MFPNGLSESLGGGGEIYQNTDYLITYKFDQVGSTARVVFVGISGF